MAEEKFEQTTRPFMMTRSNNFLELVWEDGQLRMRDLPSSRFNNSYPASLSPEIKPLNDQNLKAAGLGSTEFYSNLKDDSSAAGYGDNITPLKHVNSFLQETTHPAGFNLFFENNRKKADSQVVPVYKDKTSGSGESGFKARMERTQLTTTADNDNYLHQPSSLVPTGPLVNEIPSLASAGKSVPNAKQSHTSLGLQNFPQFLRSAILARTNERTSAQSSTRPEDMKSPVVDSKPVVEHSKVMEPNSCSIGAQGFHQNNPDLPIATRLEPMRPTTEPPEPEEFPTVPDEESEAVVRKDFATKSWDSSDHEVPAGPVSCSGNKAKGKCTDQAVATSSVYSLEASNDLSYSSLERRFDDTPDHLIACASKEEKVGAAKSLLAQGSSGSKIKQRTVIHRLSERRRRHKINKKIRMLRDLIPNSDKVDKASMLDQAIEYMKTLQLQLQLLMMSMGQRFCLPPMMLPAGMQHFQAPELAHFPPLGMGMGMGMSMSMGLHLGGGCNPTTLSAPSMLGFPGQMLSMSVPPFFPSNMVPAYNISGIAPTGNFLRSASGLSSNDSVHNLSNPENNVNAHSSTFQASSRI